MILTYRPPALPKMSCTHHADALSFMCRKTHGGGIQYWNVTGSGNYFDDCALGKKLGREYLDYVARHMTNGNAKLLGWIVCDMVATGATKGLVLGFMGIINEHAMAAAGLLVDLAPDNPN